MSTIEDQVLACLKQAGGAGAVDIARQIRVSTAFVQSVLDRLASEERVVTSGSTGDARLSEKEERRLARYKRLEQWRRPFLRW